MRLGALGRRDHRLVPRPGIAIEDIGPDRAMQQRAVLTDHADRAAQRGLRHLGHVLPVDQDLALLGIAEPQQQVHEAGFTRARAADQAHLLARLDGQVHMVEPARCRAHSGG